MDLLTFKGGVHPYDGKELSKDKPIKAIEPKGDLIYLMSQHIGAPAKPVVSIGERVLVGQMIAEAGGFVSAPVHASVSGTVKGFGKQKNAVGDMVDCIIVENDGLYEEIEYEILDSLKQADKSEIIDRIRKAGVVGLGGAGFPTHVKLSPKEPDKIEYCLVNGAECEPYLTSDYRRMMESPELVVGGLKCMLKLFDNAVGYICIEDNKPECIRKMQELVKDESRIQVKVLQTKYPQGAERSLIYAVTGREINSSMLPADAGCIVDNVDTVVAIYHAVVLGHPLFKSIMTVTGDAVANPGNFEVRTGMNYAEILEAAGGLTCEPEKIISGGPMMGFALYGLDVPVIKTSSSILCLKEDQVTKYEQTACINCGRCVSACPAHLVPAHLVNFARIKDEERFLKFDGMECCECGSCSYACPAKRPLAQTIKSMRRLVLANRKRK